MQDTPNSGEPRSPSGWPSTPASAGAGLRLAAVLAAALGLAAALCSAWFQDMTTDEPLHLAWSRRLLESGATGRTRNEYFESKTPVSVVNVLARKAARRAFGAGDPRLLLFCARLPTVAEFAALLAVMALLARRWLDARTAALAVIACALDPSLIAHASLATVDVPYALAHLLGLAAALAFARDPSPRRGLVLGLALGLAFAVKLTAFLLLPAVGLALLVTRREGRWTGRAARVAAGLGLAALAAALALCAAYGFAGVARPLAETAWSSRPMAFVARWCPRLRLPVPGDFLTGVDLTLAREQDADWRVVMLGRIHRHGVVYYFPLLWLMKTPVLLLLAQVAGLVLAAGMVLRRRAPVLVFLAANLVLALAYFMLAFHAQIGYRFVLMCLPLSWLVAGAGLARLSGRWAAPAAALVLVLSVGEDAAYAGNQLAFTNLAVQPKKRVFRWITDSNVDWGQNRDKVESYRAMGGVPRAALDPPHLLPGPNLLRHDLASGNFRFQRYRWVRESLDPVAHFGHTYLLFDVTPPQFERLLAETRTLDAGAADAAACSCGPERRPLGGREPLRLRPGPRRAVVLCLSSAGGADVVVEDVSGALLLGPVEDQRRQDFLQAGQQAWYRLPPGLHAVTASSTQRFEGTLRPARGDVSWGRCSAAAGAPGLEPVAGEAPAAPPP